MLFSALSRLFKSRSTTNPPAASEEKKIYSPFSKWYVEWGVPVLFTDEQTGVSKTIVDKNGKIMNFPGIEDEEKVKKIVEIPTALQPYAQYGSNFGCHSEEYIMYWTVQLDGRYWEDEDSFGGTSDSGGLALARYRAEYECAKPTA